jgi:hypothetical protein
MTTVNPSRAGHVAGSGFAFGFPAGRGAGRGAGAVVVDTDGAGGAGGATTTGEVATIVREPLGAPVSRPATIPAVAEPAATRRRSREAKIQSPG